jgi:putative membrane protein
MSPERRPLHPAAIAVYALAALREAALPLVALFVLRGFDDPGAFERGVLYAAAGTAIAAVMGFLRWRTTEWWVTQEAIHHRRGLLAIKETDVPLTRVQALDFEQGPVQRLFGVQSVHVQTGGGGARGEIVLEALGAREIAALQGVLAGRLVEAAPVAEEARRRLGGRELLLTALTAGQLGVILPVLAAAGQIASQLFEDEGFGLLGLVPDTGLEIALVVAGLVVAAWLLSMAGSVVAFSGFTVAREASRLRTRRGLFARREATVPVGRVRALVVVEGLLRRPFGLAALRMEVIGHAEEPAAAQTLFPLLRRDEVRDFLAELLPEFDDALEGLEPLPRRAARRYALVPAAWTAVAAVAVALFTPVGAWALLAVPLAVAYGLARHRAAGWRLRDGRLAVRSLRLARRTVLAPARNRESHALAQTVLQRRASLADVEVAFGKQTTARVHHLEAATARALFERLAT